MPGISKWWGGLLLPVLAWFPLIAPRSTRGNHGNAAASWPPRTAAAAGFGCAAVFGILLSVLFVTGN